MFRAAPSGWTRPILSRDPSLETVPLSSRLKELQFCRYVSQKGENLGQYMVLNSMLCNLILEYLGVKAQSLGAS